MIPKVIHYCWFGKNELPKNVAKCIESWRKYCPDYQIIQWNESNYDIQKNKFMYDAYTHKKWAFVSDYARLDIIYNNGGIYLDTDVEILKSIDDLLSNKSFTGLEAYDSVNTGLCIGAESKLGIIKNIRDLYDKESFIINGKINEKTCVEITTNYLKKLGFVEKNQNQIIADLSIYATEYFCPIEPGSRKNKTTNNTYSIHWYDATWKEESDFMKKINFYLIPYKKKLKRYINKIFGDNTYEKIKGYLKK